MNYKVLFRERPSWLVGEKQADRDARVRSELAGIELGPDELASDCYPGDWSGFVLSVIPADGPETRNFSPADTADPNRRVVTLELTDEELTALRSRRSKVGLGVLGALAVKAVSFDERWGRIAPVLRGNFEDAEAAERESETPPDDPLATATFENTEGWRFAELAALARRMLPKNECHTGAGLYKVDGTRPAASDHYWRMESTNPPDDGTVGGNDGTGTNVTLTGGWYEKGLEFNGDTSVVNVGDVATLNSAQKFTVAFWAVQDVLDVLDIFFRKYLDGNHRVQVSTYTDGKMYFFVANGGAECGFFDYSTAITAGAWHHIVMVYDGTQADDAGRLKVYVDGEQMALSFAGTIPAAGPDLSGQDLTFGRDTTSLDGKLDEVRVYSDALTATEVLALYAGGLAHADTISSAVKDNGTSTITLTTGISRDCEGEVFISGGNAYAITSKTDDTHIVVVGDATGESGACVIAPYSTIMSALDQLSTDQGAAAFTASQYVRVFAGTYDENVEPNANLDPDGQRLLVIEGDPADDRGNVVIAPSGGAKAVYCNCDQLLLRHLKVAGTPTTEMVEAGTGNTQLELVDCIVTGAKRAVHAYKGLRIADCDITVTADVTAVQHQYESYYSVMERTVVNGPGSGPSSQYGVWVRGRMDLRGCVVAGFDRGVYFSMYSDECAGGLYNCTFYDCSFAVHYVRSWSISLAQIVNCVFASVNRVLLLALAPEETAAHSGVRLLIRSNCFDYTTSFARLYSPLGDKTYAEFTAYGLVDAVASGPGADLDATDPLLTNPAAGDFSLQSASPCRHAGHGSGVTEGVNGVAFDAYHPDIGASATGPVAAPTAPSAGIAGVAGPSITVSVSGDEGVEHTAQLVRPRSGEVADSSSRQGDGDIVLVAPDLSERYFVVVTSWNAAGRSLPGRPLDVFVPEGESPFAEVRAGVVARLRANADLQDILGTDDTGEVPVYAARPGLPARVPSVTYTLEGTPDGELDRAGRWLMKLSVEAFGGSSAVNDSIVGALDEVLSRRPFEGTSWSVKRMRRTGDVTRWSADGRTESRRTAWDLVADRAGS